MSGMIEKATAKAKTRRASVGDGAGRQLPPFGELLQQLGAAHELELQKLRIENQALRAKVRSVHHRPDSDEFDVDSVDEEKPIQTTRRGSKQPSKPAMESELDCPRPPDLTMACFTPTKRLQTQGTRNSSFLDKVLTEKSPRSNLALGEDGTIDGDEVALDVSAERSPIAAGDSRWSWTLARISRHTKAHMPNRKGTRSAGFFETIVPTSINFQVLCHSRFPGMSWDNLTTKQKVELLRLALKPKHLLINPHSKLMKRWDILILIALTFVGLVTPYEVVFLNEVDWYLFAVNRMVDLIFIFDMVLQFFLVVEIQQPHRGGSIMVRDPKIIRCRYIKSWFGIDLVSIFPFDLLTILLSSSAPWLQRAKILRCVKLMRIVKMLRILRSSKILERWKNRISITFATQKLIKFTIALLLTSHWMACVWGLCGVVFSQDLCDSQGNQVITSYNAQSSSWLAVLFLGGKTSPDSPCNPFEVYIASLHWAVMTLTSIGYGDIVPVRVEEYIVGIACMLAGGMIWANVIGSLCSIISNGSPVERNFEANTDLLNLAMDEARVPMNERPRYREYLREAKAYDRRVSFGQVAETFSPMLRKQLMFHITKDALDTVHYFREPDAPRTFLMDVAHILDPKFFSKGEPLTSLRHKLCLLDRGTVSHGSMILVPPSVFHEDFIIQKKYQRSRGTNSLTFTQVLVLSFPDFELLLKGHDEFARKVRICAGKMCFLRILVLLKRMAEVSTSGARPTLREAFDEVSRRERQPSD